MPVISIRELKQSSGSEPAQAVIHVQLENNRQRTTKNGDPYHELHFADAESSLVLRVWKSTPMFEQCAQLEDHKFYEITGEFGVGNDGKSIDSRNWSARELDSSEIGNLLSGSAELREKQEYHFAFITETVAQIADPRLNYLASTLLKKWGARFQRTGAARDYHHARRGGLVEHVGQMMRSAVKICEAYSWLNRDLLVTGVLFHDIGKLWENVYSEKGFTMPYTEVSELIGHIPMGMEIVNMLWRDAMNDPEIAEQWEQLEPPNDRVRLHLLHLIVAHHGELAFGSPVVPKTPEAQALHYIDNLDAKMEMFEQGYLVAEELGKNVYQRVRPLPGRLVRPLEKWGAPAGEIPPPEPPVEDEPF
ncbi:MAG: HD domain-containing protein [Verrucomicrobiales bacterium]|nr:HD domain-containing protein [Verrucomicrobiales bacterium]